jgi:hypothetical protein
MDASMTRLDGAVVSPDLKLTSPSWDWFLDLRKLEVGRVYSPRSLRQLEA